VVDGLLSPGKPEIVGFRVGRYLALGEAGEKALNQVHLREGRFPVRSEEVEVILHEGFARRHHLKPGSRIMAQLEGRREWLRVVGIGISPQYVVAVSPASPMPNDERFGVVWMRRMDLERLSRFERAITGVSLRLESTAKREAVKLEVDRLTHAFGARSSIGREEWPSARFVDDEIAQQRTTAWVAPTAFLAMAAFLVHIMVGRLLTKQRPQIATLRALGYRSSELLRHYLSLVSLLSLGGIIPGVLLGRVFGWGYAQSYEPFFRFPDIDFSLSGRSVLVGVVVGVLPGMGGAWRGVRAAVRLAPAEAMRPPAPVLYGRAGWERLRWWKRVSMSHRILARNLFHHPLRLVILILGLSFATSIVVTAGSWLDVFNWVIETQFHRVQREDLNVMSTRPVGLSSFAEWLKLPGVRAIEGYRLAPVRLRYRQHRREGVVLGLPPSSMMRQVLDRDLKPVTIHEEGIVMNRLFEKLWHLKEGDRVEVESLEGRLLSWQVPVSSFSDQLLGISGVMAQTSLSRALQEQNAQNGFSILVDPERESALQNRVGDFPVVVSMRWKRSVLEGFTQGFGRVILVTTAILMGFAWVMSGATIFNFSQVSLSERQWELSVLAVLGFSRRQVKRLLSAELWIQVALSLAPGCLLGWGLTAWMMATIHTEEFQFPLVLTRRTFGIAIAVTLVSSLLSTLWVRRVLERLPLSEALKSGD
jgi:putative ABC transport system permease protein